MGKFANTDEEIRATDRACAEALGEEYVEHEAELPVGTRLSGGQTRQPWHGHSEWDAFGHVVPAFRRTAADETLKRMGFDAPGQTEIRHSIVTRMADAIERDESHRALEECLKAGVDVTGCYRLLAVMTSEQEPDEAPVPASYLDLVA